MTMSNFATSNHVLIGIRFLEPGRPVWECSCISSRRMPLRADESVDVGRRRASASHARHREVAIAQRGTA